MLIDLKDNKSNVGHNYAIPIDKVQSVIDDLSQENYKIFLNSKKYNL